MITQQNYVGKLLCTVPEFTPTYNEHIVAMEGELLGHPLFGELFHYTMQQYEAGNIETVNRVLVFINQAAQSEDDYITELVHVSFVEYIAGYEATDYFKEQLRDEALAMYEQIINWKPSTAV